MGERLPWHVRGIHKLIGESRRELRFIFRRMPSVKRCKVCWVPMRGPFSVPFQIMRIRPSRKNPGMCAM